MLHQTLMSGLAETQEVLMAQGGAGGSKMPLVLFIAAIAGVGLWMASSPGGQQAGQSDGAPALAGALPPPAGDELRLVFTYGSEKETWIAQSTALFNQQHVRQAGKTISVEAIPMGSGDCMDEILAGRRKPHLISPASAAFIKMGNARARSAEGRDLVPATDNLVLSPVVIAMWKPMAEALGWGRRPLGWADVLAVATQPRGWAAYEQPQWGPFRFGHTHPDFSNSGLTSIFAEVYAGAGKVGGLTLGDLAQPAVANQVQAIERAVVHYGSSTGFFAKKLVANGPDYLSAAVLYENNVIESYQGATPSSYPPLVALYPKEGTFWSDHPAGIVDRDWVTPAHRQAARAYLDFLLAKPQQEAALRLGFRPAAVEVAVGAPLDAAHGVDPQEPKTTLEVPSVEVMDGILRLWRANKKHAHVVLVMDVSGSMNEDGKLGSARLGAAQLVAKLEDGDAFSLLAFSDHMQWLSRGLALDQAGRATAQRQVEGLIATGGTALYDAVDAAYAALAADAKADQISAVVVLTDGADSNSRTALKTLLTNIRADRERASFRVFTIGYGKDANRDVLKGIADATQAKFYAGTQDNIVSVFKDISTFF